MGQSFAPGVYVQKKPGKYGDVEVTVELTENAIASVKVTDHHENTHYAKSALEYLPQKIVALQDVRVDAVSGATLTSKAVLAGVEAALEQAGGNAEALTPQPDALNQVEQHMTPGVYTAEAQGKWAPKTVDGARFLASKDPQLVKVEVEVDETSIKSVKLKRCTDNDHFIKPVIERVIPAIVDEQSLFVDVVTGSTLTSAAIIKATSDCLEQAGANMVGFTASKPRKTDVVTYDADVCIVGGGHAGTLAAVRALEAGASVIVIEKAGRVGGRGFCPSAMTTVESKVQAEAGVKLTKDDLYKQLYDQTGGRANNLLVRNVVDQCGATTDWLIDHGFKTAPINLDSKMDEAFIVDFGRGQDKFQALYDNYVTPLGGTVLLETRAQELITEDGKVVGVKAVQLDGTTVIVNCKAAVVGTGGFGGNPEMLRRLVHSSNFYERGLTTQSSGEGIAMCENIGAQLGPEIMPHMQEYLANIAANFTDNMIKYISYGGFLTVNLEGKRFMNECACVEDAMGSGCASLRVQGGAYYYVIDQEQANIIQEKGINGYYDGDLMQYLNGSVAGRSLVPIPTLQESLDDAIAKGQAWKGDSVEELAEKIGFDNPQIFIDNFNRYNELCRKGVDEDFGKIPRMMNEHTFPCYVLKSYIPIMGTLGGVKINERFEALNTTDQAIPGLYVVGQEGSGFYTYPYYSTRCATTTYAYTSGYLAGAYAAEYAKGLAE